MPSYKINARNSFTVNGRTFFVARTRYMDDGMQVFEATQPYITPINGFWGCLLLPDYQRKIPCREVAKQLVQAFIGCNEWMPNQEQIAEISKSGKHLWGYESAKQYQEWHSHFNKI